MLINKISKDKLDRIKDTFIVSSKLLKLLWDNEKLLFTGNLIAVLVPAVVPFVNAYIFKLLIDAVVASFSGSSFNFSSLYYLISGLFISSLALRLSFSYQDYVVKILYTKFPLTLYQVVLNKISSLDLQYFEDPKFKDVLQKVKDTYTWRPQEQLYMIFFLMQSLVQVSIAFYAILTLNVFLAVLILAVSIPDLINQLVFSRFSWIIWDMNTPYRKKFSYLQELIQDRDSVKEIKVFGLRLTFLSDIIANQRKFFTENKAVANKQFKVNTVFNFFDTIVLVGISVFVIFQAIQRKITIGDVSFYESVISNFSNGIGGLFRNMSKIFEHSLYNKHVFEVLDMEPKIKIQPNPKKIDFNQTPKIEFKNISYKYPGTDKYVFKDFSLTINPGEKVALVGENGSGKTTLVKLLARFYDTDEGVILINGTNLKDLDLESWYKTLGILFQDFIKYEYPVKDNILFGKIWEKEDLEMIVEAAKDAGAQPMIKKFEKEYDQMLGRTFEGGLELSGGQWQKIALARAFYRNAPVLILDEPTSAIDARAEAEIFNKVEKLSKDKTVLIISHRFSTVRNAEKIYVINNGKIIEQGSHPELLKLNGEYSTLFKLQARGYQ